MSYKNEILHQIMAKVAQMLDQDAVDNLRIEVIEQGKRIVIVSDSNMLAAHEREYLLPGQLPKLRLV